LITAAVAQAAQEAGAIVAATSPLAVVLAPPPARPPIAVQPPLRRWLSFAVPTGASRDADRLVLEHELIRVEAHPQTGGLLSLRRDRDGANRLSQQLAVRTTRTAGGGGGWEAAEDGVLTTRMVADAVERVLGENGRDSLVSRGRLVAADGGVAARFLQIVSLVEGMPLAVLDIEVELERPLAGSLLDSHVAARFAWHENEHVEIRRSLLTQSVATERTRFTAPHFIEIVPESTRVDVAADAVTILTGGLPWHLLSTPHVLDSLLAGGSVGRISRRLAIGLGLRRPWDSALALAAGTPLGVVIPGLPENVRLTVAELVTTDGQFTAGRFGLLESAGVGGEVTIDWGRPVARATVVDFTGGPRTEPAVAIDGTRTVVSLERYQWLQLDLGFAG
jgi:hypothetical protein